MVNITEDYMSIGRSDVVGTIVTKLKNLAWMMATDDKILGHQARGDVDINGLVMDVFREVADKITQVAEAETESRFWKKVKELRGE